METFEYLLASLVCCAWLAVGWIALQGARRLPRLMPTAAGGALPSLSVIVPARNEAATLPRSLPSLLRQTYPGLEVIALDDRSTDATGRILESLNQQHPQLTVIRITSLPDGWLGKTHALFVGSQAAHGDWLLFTDADVVFHPRCLETAMAYAMTHGPDHLVVLPRTETGGFWEPILVGCFGLLFGIIFRPWQASDPRSRAFIGVGAFNLIRRSAYERIGTHRAMAMAMVDDLELGRLVKTKGLRQVAVQGDDLLRVRWQIGLSGIVHGLEKNSFAGMGYSVIRTTSACLALAACGILPFLAAPLGQAKLLWSISALAGIIAQACFAREARLPFWSALFYPAGTAVLCFTVVRSMLLAIWRRRVEWRGTSYPLSLLRRPRRDPNDRP
jgi:cellulose synthase/poly-beta-1,6-N-acetylglucosamine synthase-like glycosyltransferase